jgi:hypothetical protein
METNEPRRLSELLEMSSYQGMTDEEVEMVIAWREERAITKAETLAKLKATAEAGATMAEQARLQREHAQSVLDALVANPPKLFALEDNRK